MSAITVTRPSARIWRAGIIAAAVAAVVNAAVALVGRVLLSVPADFRPLWPLAVAVSTIFAVLIGTLVYFLLARRSPQRADRTFTIMAWGFAVLSLLSPLNLLISDQPLFEGAQGASLGPVLLLCVLHLIPVPIVVRLLTASKANRR